MVKLCVFAPAGTGVGPLLLVGPGWECAGQPQSGFCTFTCGAQQSREEAGEQAAELGEGGAAL